MIRYQCTQCGEGIAVDDSKAGSGYVCPLCGAATRVPGSPPVVHLDEDEEEAELERLRAEARPRRQRRVKQHWQGATVSLKPDHEEGFEYTSRDVMIGVLLSVAILTAGIIYRQKHPFAEESREHAAIDRSLLAGSSDAASVAFEQGRRAEAAGRKPEAEAWYFEAATRSPQSAVAWVKLAEAQTALGRVQQAEESASRAMALAQASGDEAQRAAAHRAMASIRMRQGDMQGAAVEGADANRADPAFRQFERR